MALFGSLWSSCFLLCLALHINRSLADDESTTNSVIEKQPIGVCMWPTPESAVMTCDSGSLVLLGETYMTRLVGRTDKCSALHAAKKPEYASCRLPIPVHYAQELAANCNFTQQCTLGSFITGSLVVIGSTTCGNGTDTALERNFLVIKWGCIGYAVTTPPEVFDDANNTDSAFADSSTFSIVWIVPVYFCFGVLTLGGLLTGLLIWRRDLIQNKAHELRRLRREQRSQAKLQLAAESGGPLPPPDALDGDSAEAGPRGDDVASWIERAPSYSAVAGVSGTLKSAVDRIPPSTVESSDVLPPAYVHASAVVIDEQQKRTEHRRHKHRRRGDSEQFVISSSSASADGAATSSHRHQRSSGGRSRSHDRSAGGGKKSHSSGRRRSHHDGTQSEMSDADLGRQRKRREQLHKGAVHQIRSPTS